MTATVTLSRPGEENVAKLPLSSVLNRGTGPSVYVVDDGGALALRKVTIASFNGDVALVTSGVSDGDRIVTLGVQKLEPGLRVRAIEVTN
jgi:multidrug efflux pump subunit AcrA (membrane-fusion protein)